MNWDEHSERVAHVLSLPVPVPSEPGDLQDTAIRLNHNAVGYERGFYAGARWQREQLRTPEAHDRAAETLWSTSDKRTSEDWAHEDSEIRKYFIDSVEEFSTALLGED